MQFLTVEILAYIFAFLMGLSMLIYSVLDGYDLGVGVLTPFANDKEKDNMIATIGPFWDANETWLVLGVGILLVAFPKAHGIILTSLYLPVGLMLGGLIFRGVAFDFRAKVKAPKKQFWNRAFFAGSFLASMSQGYMLGSYILGFEKSLTATLFSLFVGALLTGGYALIGSCWLIAKTENELQKKSVRWAHIALVVTILGIATISLLTPLTSPRIFERWFSFPELFFLAPIPVITGLIIIALYFLLEKMPLKNDRLCFAPFLMTAMIFVLCFVGLAYSFYPYIVPEQLKIIDATISSRQSMLIIFFGAVIVLPFLMGYTVFVYKVFKGKAGELKYN